MRRVALSLLLPLAFAAVPAEAVPPAEGDCPVISAGDDDGTGADTGIQLEEGMVLSLDNLIALRSLLPPEVWNWREAFFFEGMRMELGPCHRRYPTAPFYSHATLRHWEKVRLDDDGNLHDYVAGLPFPLDRLDPRAEDAGTRWAWNFELRYRGAGPAGSFKITDMPSRIGGVEVYEGEFFQVQTRNRADLPDDEYTVPEANENIWVGGGRFYEPFHARHLAWRQMRPERVRTKYKESDRTWVYVPDMRRSRRAAATWVDGFYTPRYSAAQQVAAGGPVPIATGHGYLGLDTISPTGAVPVIATAHLRRGFVGLSLRPNAYDWTYMGERDVIAPLNGSYLGWPEAPDRNYGPSGLSLANDTWDVRRAVVIQGVARREEANVGQVILYIDHQTQQPLFFVSRRRNGLLVDVGILAHRFSGDRPAYPTWPDGRKAYVFDPVAASFYGTADGGTGWRRESYDIISAPRDDANRRRMTSVAELDRGH